MTIQSQPPPIMTDKKPGRMPIYLSALAFPGAGQFLQKRWIPAIIYTVISFSCVFYVIIRLLTMWISFLTSAIDNKPFIIPSFSNFLEPVGIFLCVYIVSVVDAAIAYRKGCRLHAERQLDSAVKRITTLAVLFTAMVVLDANAQCDEIFQAIRSNDVTRIDAIIEKFGFAAVKTGTSDGITPLHLAAALNRFNAAAFLITAGADVNARNSAGFTPLHWAAGKDATETASLLLKVGADVNARTKEGITPLHWAANKNSTNIIAMLIAAGADVETKTDSGFTPLHWATLRKSNDAARWLAFKIASDKVDREIREEAVPRHAESAMKFTIEDEPAPTGKRTQLSETTAELKGKTLAVPIGMNEAFVFVWIEPLNMWVSKFETTNSQFKRFKTDHNSMFRESFKLNKPDQPAVYVSWNDAREYCEWLNRNYGSAIPKKLVFRLPTDTEWVAIAKCGTARIYPWGDSWPPKYGNFSDLTARKELSDWAGIKGYEDGYAVSCPVIASGSNEWNVFGLAGNVWEWCDDWFDASKHYKVRHGGSWDFDNRKSLRIDYRGFDRPDTRDDTIGFRIVVGNKLPAGS